MMPKYIVYTIEQVDRYYVVEADTEQDAFDAMIRPNFIRVATSPYEKTRRKPNIIASSK
jgi:hypothetical protein